MMDKESLLIDSLKKDLPIEVAESVSLEEIKEQLSIHINYLINHDFGKLISLLYRIDVNERKLKNLLQENKNEDAGKLIAGLIIERHLQKIKTRNEFSQKTKENDSNEEKW